MTLHEAKSMFIQLSAALAASHQHSLSLTPTPVVSPNEITRSIAANAVNEPQRRAERERGAESR